MTPATSAGKLTQRRWCLVLLMFSSYLVRMPSHWPYKTVYCRLIGRMKHTNCLLSSHWLNKAPKLLPAVLVAKKSNQNAYHCFIRQQLNGLLPSNWPTRHPNGRLPSYWPDNTPTQPLNFPWGSINDQSINLSILTVCCCLMANVRGNSMFTFCFSKCHLLACAFSVNPFILFKSCNWAPVPQGGTWAPGEGREARAPNERARLCPVLWHPDEVHR